MGDGMSAWPRVGHGYDLHRLVGGGKLVVCGVELESDRGCVAHSDGDVVFHAVTDAVLGALGGLAGWSDIGGLFPDDDPAWAGADSGVFVAEAARRMRGAGYGVGNVDVTVALERPRVGPHKAAMRERLAGALGCSTERVNVKAKTGEGVDAVGRGEAVACWAVVLLIGGGLGQD